MARQLFGVACAREGVHAGLAVESYEERVMVHLVTVLKSAIAAMRVSNALPFRQRVPPTCQGVIAALTLLMTHHAAFFCRATRVLWSCLFFLYHLYKESLSVVADSSICEEDDNDDDAGNTVDDAGNTIDNTVDDAGNTIDNTVDNTVDDAVDDAGEMNEEGEAVLKELLSKGPVQVEDSGVISAEDHIAKDKLDCRGHLIGAAGGEEARRLKELMLSCWLICKHASEGMATLFEIAPDSLFAASTMVVSETDVRGLHSYLEEASLNETVLATRASVVDSDVLFLLLDLLTSMLTIKHIGGIVYVAEAITRLLIRLGRVNQKNTFVAR